MMNTTNTTEISFSTSLPKSKADVLIIPVFADKDMSLTAQEHMSARKSYIQNYLDDQKKFTGKMGQTFILAAPQDTLYKRYLLLGLGKKDDLKVLELETAGGKLTSALSSCGAGSVVLDTRSLETYAGAHIAIGLSLARYKFVKYKTDAKSKDIKILKLKVVSDDAKESKEMFAPMQAAADGVVLARDLVNEPPNMLYPESFAKKIKDELKPLGVKVTILDEKKMLKMGMGGIIAVGMASVNQPRLVIMEWKGATNKSDKPLGFVGKGVTFDTGGISLKPGAGMDLMKMDMGGSAAVVGLMKSLALRKANVNVVSVVGLAENMPDGKAYRPADIITAYSGKTVEILNTDAEGRLVLMDALTYIQQEYDPKIVIDLATLTGAIMVALGHEYSGAYVNTPEMWSQLEKASDISGDKLWRMPLDKVYRKEMDSTIADLKNLGGRYGGSCSAAGFLENFIDEGRAWAHLDIAGTAYINSSKPTTPKGGTGAGVRVLDTFVKENYG